MIRQVAMIRRLIREAVSGHRGCHGAIIVEQ